MDTSSVDNSMRYCNKEGIMCANANSDGYCNITACINHDLLRKYSKYSMCENCAHSWNGNCDKGFNPMTCKGWEPDSHG